LSFGCNIGYANAPQYYVILTPCVLIFLIAFATLKLALCCFSHVIAFADLDSKYDAAKARETCDW